MIERYVSRDLFVVIGDGVGGWRLQDRRCLLSILIKYYCIKTLDDSYSFSHSGLYKAPPSGTLGSVRDYVKTHPITEEPEVSSRAPTPFATENPTTPNTLHRYAGWLAGSLVFSCSHVGNN